MRFSRFVNLSVRPKLILLVAVMSAVSVGCVTSYHYTHTAPRTFEERPADCQFRIVSTVPDLDDYEEIGIVDMTFSGFDRPSTAADFQAHIRDDVCKAGGDVVVRDSAAGYGRATVFRKKGE